MNLAGSFPTARPQPHRVGAHRRPGTVGRPLLASLASHREYEPASWSEVSGDPLCRTGCTCAESCGVCVTSRVPASRCNTGIDLLAISSVCGTKPILGVLSIQQSPTAKGSRAGSLAPCARRAPELRVRTLLTRTWLHLLESWCLLKPGAVSCAPSWCFPHLSWSLHSCMLPGIVVLVLPAMKNVRSTNSRRRAG